jgi:hypothetical protein
MVFNMAKGAERSSLNGVHGGVLYIAHIPCFKSLAIHKSFHHILPTRFRNEREMSWSKCMQLLDRV